jgi:hypothetical protein
MRTSGTASLREMQEGFKAYAEKAIAANGGVATEALKVEAAMVKVAIQTDSTGKAIVSSMAQGAAAIKTVEDGYRQLGLKTPAELKKISDANAAAWDKIKGDSSASLETLKAAFSTYAQSAIAASGSVGSAQRMGTEGLLTQEAAVKGLAVSFDAEGKMVVQTQAEAAAAIGKSTDALHGQKRAVDEVTAALERENAAQEKAISAAEKANDLKKRAIDLENKRLNRDSEGFGLDDQGKRRVESGSPIYSERAIYDMAKDKGLTDKQALEIAAMFKGSQQANEMGTQLGERWMDKLTRTIDAMTLANVGAKSRADAGQDQYGNPMLRDKLATPGTASAPDASPAPAPSGSTITHVFEIGGRSTSVSVASGGDSANLVSVINQLKLAKLSSNG